MKNLDFRPTMRFANWLIVLFLAFSQFAYGHTMSSSAPTVKESSSHWVASANSKLKLQAKAWFSKVDSLRLLNSGSSYEENVKYPSENLQLLPLQSQKRLPLPWGLKRDKALKSLTQFSIQGNALLLAEFDDQDSEYFNHHTILYARRQAFLRRIAQGSGEEESISFVRLGPKLPILMKVENFAGGSGIECGLFAIERGKNVRRLLELNVWGEGGWVFYDLDRDGNYEVIHRTRISHPSSLERKLEKLPDFDAVTPMLYQTTIHQWRNKRFIAVGTRFEFE